MDDMNLDDVLNEGAETAPQLEVQPAPQEAPEPVRDESGRFAPKGDDEDATPASDDKSKGLEAGISAERKKRQEMETQVEALRRELEQLRNPQEPAPPPPSIWEDDQAALGHVHNSAVAAAVQQATYNARLDMSEMMARQANPDFEDMKAEFMNLAQVNPTLAQQALADPHPWQKAYQIARNARAASELGATNLAELEAKLREQIIAERAQPTVPNLPNSLADAQSARGNSAPAPKPLTLEEILGR